ncbi:hypothetical protein D9M71_565370 [compost metagenome]
MSSANRVSAPSVRRSDAPISSSTPTSSPLSKARRSLKLARKSSSPRMARSVISETCSPTPAALASSSITSASISVESMSNTARRRLRRNSESCWKAISTFSSWATLRNSARSACGSAGSPRTENSMQPLPWSTGVSSATRPDSRSMWSMFKPYLAVIELTRCNCSAVTLRVNRVTM